MLIDEFVDFCNREYKNTNCIYCSSKCRDSVNCSGNSCKKCLDDIHFHKNVNRDNYNCSRLIDYYVCRYSYKYCSEIVYALKHMQNHLQQYPYFDILSLGCGGAPDLMAFDYMQFHQPISYIGLDSNPSWKSVHNYICSLFSEKPMRKVQFFELDVVSGQNFMPANTNIIILQYLISAFYDNINGSNLVKRWFHMLTEHIICTKSKDSPLMIIINDVDSINTGRDAFDYFARAIEDARMRILCKEKMRFKDSDYYSGSEQYPTRRNLFDIPDGFLEDYCVAIKCESAQYILEVE